MQALLSFEQAPPLAAPLRFFLTAPLFAILAALLLLWTGPELFASRWTPAALALTHLITVGFMLQVMLGAMLQILPVVAGANLTRPLAVATLVHVAIALGALLLAAAFLSYQPLAFTLAAALVGSGVGLFVVAAGRSLFGVPSSDPTIRGLKTALVGLSITVCLGMLLATALGGSITLPLLQLTAIHLGWGLIGWSSVLLAAVAYVVVPMFQMTPAYPEWFAGRFSWAVLTLLSAWSAADALAWTRSAIWLAAAAVLAVAVFATLTLQLQRRSRRARVDATQRYWSVAMLCTLAACTLWLAAGSVPGFAERREWPLVCGVLALFGGLMSVTIGMLYKIVPFLVWSHLQNLGGGRVIAPNMNKVIAAGRINGQMYAHFVALALLLGAALWPPWFARPAGLALLTANAWLLYNLLGAMSFYRRHRLAIEATMPNAASSR
ncbi:hypothetical protein [Accumulibacter sp.]|uniref:hypothetical protein n=1 Tax=Accumulibacter sp. TaxID=2053492 RepID=UPI00263846AE|nr:hypothetical protein [Accumulibacter sp.]